MKNYKTLMIITTVIAVISVVIITILNRQIWHLKFMYVMIIDALILLLWVMVNYVIIKQMMNKNKGE